MNKNFVLSILLVFVFSCSVFSQQKYSYIEYELPNNVVREGTLLFNEKDQILEIDVNVIGKIHSSVYKTQAKKIEGFNIWDIKSPNGRFEISIFTFYIGSNNKFTDDFKTSKVDLKADACIETNFMSTSLVRYIFKSVYAIPLDTSLLIFSSSSFVIAGWRDWP